MMLAVFLLGIFLGSLLLIPLISKIKNLRTVLIILQGGIGVYVIGSIYSLDSILSSPWNAYNLANPTNAFWNYFKDSAALMLFPALLLGMCFPLLIQLISKKHQNIGEATGQVYAANTLGAILGSLLCGFFFLPHLGSQTSLTLLATINFLTMVFLFRTGNYLTPVVRRVMTLVFTGLILFINISIPNNLLNSFFMRDLSLIHI